MTPLTHILFFAQLENQVLQRQLYSPTPMEFVRFKMMYKIIKNGFTLIELLVVISIIGILMGVSLFGIQGARESSRDSKRKADLEFIRAGLELYKADCNDYPPHNSSFQLNSTVVGDTTPTTCAAANTYISSTPTDPLTSSGNYYRYVRGATNVTYELCAYLEGGTASVTCGGAVASCGTTNCNYKVTNP